MARPPKKKRLQSRRSKPVAVKVNKRPNLTQHPTSISVHVRRACERDPRNGIRVGHLK